jgi:Ca2+-binding RTX toxin-like protein
LSGGGGSDILYAGTGDDIVDAGDGDDILIGGDGAGNDKYIGGAGTDTVKYTSATAAITVDLVRGTATSTAGQDAAKIGTDTLSGIENVTAGNYNDIIKGSIASNVLTGGLGTDSLYGGADKVRDVFDFNAITESKTGTARDKVYDFVTKIDKLDLSGIDANTATAKAGDQAFLFNNTTAKANSVWYAAKDVDGSSATKDIIVYGDVNGDAKSDFEIGLVGVTSIATTDFVL